MVMGEMEQGLRTPDKHLVLQTDRQTDRQPLFKHDGNKSYATYAGL